MSPCVIIPVRQDSSGAILQIHSARSSPGKGPSCALHMLLPCTLAIAPGLWGRGCRRSHIRPRSLMPSPLVASFLVLAGSLPILQVPRPWYYNVHGETEDDKAQLEEHE